MNLAPTPPPSSREAIPVASPAANAPLAPPLPREGFVRLSPLNRRRLANFRANRRGYLSFWLFLVLFVLSLFAEFIANDRPVVVSYKGEILFPVFVDYPEEKFGGFLAQTDYRDPVIAKEIAENGWALWPPIRFSYRTHNLDLPVPAPAPPTWMLEDGQCRAIAERSGGTGCRDIEWNWLGPTTRAATWSPASSTGSASPSCSASSSPSCPPSVGVLAGAVQGYFGGWVDPPVPALHRGLDRDPGALPPHHHRLHHHPELLGACSASCSCSPGSPSSASSAPSSCAAATSSTCALPGRSGCRTRPSCSSTCLPNAMVATFTFLPFILNGSITTLTSLDFLGFGLPPGSPSLGELLAQGKANLQAPWLGLTGFFVIAFMLSLLIFTGEAVRDAFDPRKTFA
jgi:microcin C transport system permease protein